MVHVRLPEPGHPQVILERDGESTLLNIDPAKVIDLYKQHGAILFRGFAANLDDFRIFARRFCPTSVMNESPGRQPIDPAANIHTVDPGDGAFALHPELSREPWKPDAAFFACFSAPSAGGETTICDGTALVRELPAAVRDGLLGRRLLYVKDTWPALLKFWLGTSNPSDAELVNPPIDCPYFFRRVDGDVVRVFTRPALHRPMFCDVPAFGNFLLFARFNHGRADFPLLDDGRPVPEEWLQAIKSTGDRLSAAIAWQPGDVLMLDNTRFMHGRTAIRDIRERLIATFFGYVSFAKPDAEEVPNALWRCADFRPPQRPDRVTQSPG